MIDSIEDSKNNEFYRVINGLGIRNIGVKAAKQLAKKYNSIDNLANATYEELVEIDKKMNPIYELMQLIARKRGAIVSGGNTDDEKVARIILDDFRNCKIGKISLEEPR